MNTRNFENSTSNLKNLISSLINDIRFIVSTDKKSFKEVSKDLDTLILEASKHYISNLPLSKKEATLQEYFLKIFETISKSSNVKYNILTQFSIKGGSIDLCFVIDNIKVGIELKPLLLVQEEEFRLNRLDWKEHRDQIAKYLVGVDYVVFTNLDRFYFFSRQSVDDVKPFKSLSYEEFFNRLLEERGDLVRLLKQLERDYPIKDLDDKFLKSLKEYFSELSGMLPPEVSFHLINQIVFIRVLEDIGAVDYGTLERKYRDAINDFPEQYQKIIEQIFRGIREFYYYYFDTELLEYDVYERLKEILGDDENKWNTILKTLDRITGFGEIESAFYKGLKYYNFYTIDEDIFGKAYETFLAENRKEKGIFYTPRQITDYLVKETIQATLGKIRDELLKAIEVKDFGTAEKLSDEIVSFSVIDISCGSGPFLVKAYREIYNIYLDIDEKTKWADNSQLGEPEDIIEYKRKVRKIREKLFTVYGISSVLFPSVVMVRHIYGIDLDEKAVEITKINLWKEMMKLTPSHFNFRIIGKQKNVFPDLSFNIISGNSLTPNQELKLEQKDVENVEKVSELLEEYQRNTIAKEGRENLHTVIQTVREIKERLRISNKYDMEGEPVYFKVQFPHVFKRGGFSVVIGNPPYVRQERIRDLKDKLSKYQLYDSIADLYVYFFEQGYNILKEGGVLGFITSNKWMRANYGRGLRRFLKENTEILKIIDFGGFSVFGEASVDTCITIFRKQSPVEDHNVEYVNVPSTLETLEEVIDFVNKNIERISQSKLSEEVYVLASEKALKLKGKIEKVGKPLKKWDVRIYRGILTGYNEAFIINTKTRNEILDGCKTDEERKMTEELIKPVLRGKDIGRYYYEWNGLWVIVIPAGWTNQNRGNQDPQEFFRTKLPSLYNHLMQFASSEKGKGKGLVNRDDQGDYWWELRHCSYYDEFEKEKIIWQEMSELPSFCIDKHKFYVNQTVYMITGNNLEVLLSILNSKLAWWYIQQMAYSLSKNAYRWIKQYVELIPIPELISSEDERVVKLQYLVDEILKLKSQNPNQDTSKFEEEIDRLVYHLYGLDEDETKIIEEDIASSRKQYSKLTPEQDDEHVSDDEEISIW